MGVSLTRKYNDGQWTPSRYQSFIKSALRSASVRWPPRYQTLNDSFVAVKVNEKTGRKAKHFECAMCKNHFPQKDVQVNHKKPVIPLSGFISWDDVIERLFCEKEGLEVLCKPCHKAVTAEENKERKEYNDRQKRNAKNN